jgi:membrane associated rhomboid family serine protease
MNWLLSAYNLFNYGSQLERAYGKAQYMLFMMTQMFLLTCLATLLGQPFFPLALITGMLHVLSRTTPNEKVEFFRMRVSYWMLPACNAIADMLNAQGSIGAMVPHVMGMLSGHFYYFNKVLWPQMDGGQDWLVAPDFLVSIMNDERSSKSKDAVNKALKKRKGKGRKLGSA